MFDVSIIVVNWNTCDLLAGCLDSIVQDTSGLDLEIIVIDNASTDGSQVMVQQRFPQVHLITNLANVGFAKANNQAAAASHSQYLLLLNSDARLLDNTTQALLDVAAANPRAGIVGAQLLNADGTFQASHTLFPNLWREFLMLSGVGRVFRPSYPSHGSEESNGPQIVDYVEGACMLARREAYESIGGLDEGYFMYAEEVDLCYTMREKGWQVWYQPAAKVIHLGGGSSRHRRPQREADLYRSRVQFFHKHYGARAAWLLKLQMYGFTALKVAAHRLLQLISGGRYGRPVIPLRDLAMRLRDV